MKNKITLIKLGHVGHLVNLEKIRKWKSDIFEVTEIHCVEHLPESNVNDGFLDQKFTIKELSKIISCPKNSDIAVAIMPYRFIDNFYMHRISNNCVVISLYGIPEILEIDNISTENFILKQIYEICAIKYLVKDISSSDVYEFVHRDTRGCIFDLNGDREDILYNTEKPIICESCKDTFKKKQINSTTISTLEKELKKIKKPLILRIERRIKKYPFAAIIISGLIAISLNLIASLIWDLTKELLKNQ
ncbi:MAG: hypothetical protein CVU05_09375 [Bacteroidetes bacterium HGW-Bacteroidetes-21]|jgi:hypothetical protein|nr:MAG: hypothetical protein CVU05_09375 [Bacteroidetes bacterium HGW-Bacteroidetes-21]